MNNFNFFLEQARKTHGERFLYDRLSWKSADNLVRIFCSSHGWFKEEPKKHILNKVCKFCNQEEQAQKKLKKEWLSFSKKTLNKFKGDYCYDKKSWKGINQEVGIHCKIHGWFSQVAFKHLRSSGCSDCANNNQVLSKVKKKERNYIEFIEKARKTHQDKYEYDLSTWNGIKSKLKIKCKIHGWFEQLPSDHLRLTGCTKCGHEIAGLKRRLSEEEIIQRFRQVHGDRYDYTSLNYTTSAKNVTIACKTHGEFKQSVNVHERGDGCPKCGKRHRWTTEEFIINSQEVHGDKFTYERTKYSGALKKITITCRIHGDFTTQPSRHITRKDGCPDCSTRKHLTQDDFLARARKRFGDRYDYSLVEFVNVATPVKIICATHGVFEQPPTYHLNNAIGCGECSYNVSTKETKWLDTFEMSDQAKRNTSIMLDGRRRNVDAFDPVTNTVYEFWGDWWHGNPMFFAPEELHPKTNTTFGQLYQDTLDKRDVILKNGYNLVEIWEYEFDQQIGCIAT